MTKSECYSQISTCNAGIEEDQKKIREWESKCHHIIRVLIYVCTNRTKKISVQCTVSFSA